MNASLKVDGRIENRLENFLEKADFENLKNWDQQAEEISKKIKN